MRRLLARLSVVCLLVLALSIPPALAVPDEARDGERYDLSVTGVFPDSDGRVCASQVDSNRYRIRLINATVTGFRATLLPGSARETRLRSDSVEIDGTLYMFTTGENDAVQLLSLTPEDSCLAGPLTDPFSFEVYYLEGAALRAPNFTFVKE